MIWFLWSEGVSRGKAKIYWRLLTQYCDSALACRSVAEWIEKFKSVRTSVTRERRCSHVHQPLPVTRRCSKLGKWSLRNGRLSWTRKHVLFSFGPLLFVTPSCRLAMFTGTRNLALASSDFDHVTTILPPISTHEQNSVWQTFLIYPLNITDFLIDPIFRCFSGNSDKRTVFFV